MAEKTLAILLTARNQASGPIRKVASDVGTLDRVAGRAGKGINTLGRNLKLLATGAVIAGVGVGVKALTDGLHSLAQQQGVDAQTTAAIRSTGGAAKITAAQVRDLANALEDKTTIDNKEIQAAANLMLTFTNVRNAAGKGNDIFNQSVAIMADMATAMGTDVSAGAIQLGKALNDPVKGISALSRVGVTFDATQQKRIKAFVKEGKIAQAQKIILAELNKEFGGSAAAAANTYEGKMRRLGDAVEGVESAFATGALPVLERFADVANRALRDPKAVAEIEKTGKSIADLFSRGLDAAQKVPWSSIADAMRLAGQGAKAAFDVFTGMPPWVQTAVLTGWGLNKLSGGAITGIVGELGKGLIKGVLNTNVAVMNVNAAVMNGGPSANIANTVGDVVTKGGLVGLLIKLGLIGGSVAVGGALIAGSAALGNAVNPNASIPGTAEFERAQNRRNPYTHGAALPGRRAAFEEFRRGERQPESPGALAEFRRGERSAGRAAGLAPGLAGELAAIGRFAGSTAPSMKSMEAHLARLRELQARVPTEDRMNTNLIVTAIADLKAAIAAWRPQVAVTVGVPARTVARSTVVYRRAANSGRVGID